MDQISEKKSMRIHELNNQVIFKNTKCNKMSNGSDS